jgi:hypothetical protein
VRKAVAVACVLAAASAGVWIAWPDGGAAKALAPIPFGLSVQGRGSVLLLATARQRPQVTGQLAVLRSPRRPADEPPAVARALFAHLGTPPGTDMQLATAGRLAGTGPGAVDLGRARRLLAGLGRRSSQLFAAPTERGWACLVLAPEEVTHCLPAFADGLAWLSLEQTQTRTLAVGLVPDGVREVELAVGGAVHRARLARNGFFDELPGTTASEIDALLVTTSDGKRFRLPLDRRVFGP